MTNDRPPWASELLAGTPDVLGAAGESWVRALGGAQPAALLSTVVLAGWILFPLALAVKIQSLRDV